jgi:hypothetical protein
MWLSGLITLVFLVLHLIHFKFAAEEAGLPVVHWRTQAGNLASWRVEVNRDLARLAGEGADREVRGLADVDHGCQAATPGSGTKPAVRVRHRDRQVPGLQRPELGLQQVQLRELEEGF